MRKKLLLLLLLLIPFFANAKENINYAWDYGLTTDAVYAGEEPGGYGIISAADNAPVYQINPSSGELTKTFDSLNGYYGEYSSSFEKIMLNYAKVSGTYVHQVGNEIAIYDIEAGEITVYVTSTPEGGSGTGSSSTRYLISDMTDENLKKYTGKYYFLIKKHLADPNNLHYGYYSNGIYLFMTATEGTDGSYTFNYKIYNESGDALININEESEYASYAASATTDGIYVVKTKRDVENFKVEYIIYKYSLAGTLQYTEDLTPIIKENKSVASGKLYSYTVDFIDGVDGGLLIKLYNDPDYLVVTNCDEPGNELNPNCLPDPSSGPTLTTLLVKVDFEYEIILSVSGHGRIEVVDHALDGTGVTYKVIPDKGYVLGEIFIIDDLGNKITVNGDTFTMPSSNVTIFAEFVEIPNTGGFISVLLLMGALLVAVIALIISDKKEKIKMIS